MPTEVILPRVDMDMTEGMIAAWHVSEGDEVQEGTLIFEIETSKATMEIDAPASGIIRQIGVPVGETVPVGTAVAWIYAIGEALQEHGGAALAPSQAQTQIQTQTSAPTQASEEATLSAASQTTGEPQPLRATPAARRIARERGLELADIAGTGPHGRIQALDALGVKVAMGLASVQSAQAADRLHGRWINKGSADVPLVLLHGFAADSNSWRPFGLALSRLEPDLGMLSIDLPAHGKSTDQAAGSLDDIVAAIQRTLAAEGIDKCHLIGHSFGGAIALATVASGWRVRSLTLLAPAGLGPECNGAFIKGVTQASRRASLTPWLKQLFADSSLLDEGFIATAEQQLGSAEVREKLAALADVFFPDGTQSLDLRHVLDDLIMPTRVVWGLRDRILPAQHAEGLPGRIGVHRFAQVGHLPQVEALEELVSIVAANIASASVGSTHRVSAIA